MSAINWNESFNSDIETLINLWEMNSGEDELSRDARSELIALRSVLSAHTWSAIEKDTDPRHIFDDAGRCIRCGEGAEEHESECVEGWTQRLEDSIDRLRSAAEERDAAIERAVMAEREACAEAAEEVPLAFYDTDTRRQIAAAIRARGEGAK